MKLFSPLYYMAMGIIAVIVLEWSFYWFRLADEAVWEACRGEKMSR